MNVIERLESLRIPDSDFFGCSEHKQEIYYAMNCRLDDCLEIVWKWIREHHLELELIT